MDTTQLTGLQDYASALIGTVVPVAVQFIRAYWMKVSGKAALWLSIIISFLSVGLGYLFVDATPTIKELLSNVGLGFLLSQAAYRQLEEKLKETLR
jgi:hypothetical protein